MLNRLALRIATVSALRGRTFAGANVLDSEQQAIEEIAEDRPTPVIVVFTDNIMTNHASRNLWHASGNDRLGSGFQKLIIEIAMTQRMTLVDEDTGETLVSPGRPLTDPMLAATLDLIERQVIAALMLPKEASAWAEMWRRIVSSTGDKVSELGTAMREGVRLAGRQITLDVGLVIDPPPGEPLGPLWTDFLALVRTEARLAPLLPLLDAALANAPLPPWQAVRSTFGLTDAEASSLLYQPEPVTP